MKKRKAAPSFPYLIPIIPILFLPWWISLALKKTLELWLTNWWNIGQSETLLNILDEKSVLEGFIELEELFLLGEIITKFSETHIQKLHIGIHKETIQLIKTQNEYHLHIILHLSTNLIYFTILSGYSLFANKQLAFFNSWIQEFFYNLSDTIKAFLIIFVADFFIGFHSTRGWELIISLVYKDFGLSHNDQIISVLISTLPVILDTLIKYGIFFYLNNLSPSLVVIYDSMNE
uniref:Chloroplast envelope membrane protein n=1 Tax=Centrolepis monogyna TaxID=357899 RepID=F8RSG8_9POAL|nr:chloroplast envelope membrane protein [Centrolepis monogyna]